MRWLVGWVPLKYLGQRDTNKHNVFLSHPAAVSLGSVCAVMVKVDRILIVATSRELLGDTAIKTGAWCALQACRRATQLGNRRLEPRSSSPPCGHPCDD